MMNERIDTLRMEGLTKGEEENKKDEVNNTGEGGK